MTIENFNVDRLSLTLYAADTADRPLVVLHNYAGDGSAVMAALKDLHSPDLNLLCISNLNWDHDMTPWYAPPLSPEDTPCTGGADEYLPLLLTEILPKAKERIPGIPPQVGIAGYSLAGLFALYALYKSDAFDRAASISGSLWFPDFTEYCFSHAMKRTPGKIYLSLGDREAKTKNKLLRTVQDNTESLADHYRSLGLSVIWELNPGNHFQDAARRSAKGILAIL